MGLAGGVGVLRGCMGGGWWKRGAMTCWCQQAGCVACRSCPPGCGGGPLLAAEAALAPPAGAAAAAAAAATAAGPPGGALTGDACCVHGRRKTCFLPDVLQGNCSHTIAWSPITPFGRLIWLDSGGRDLITSAVLVPARCQTGQAIDAAGALHMMCQLIPCSLHAWPGHAYYYCGLFLGPPCMSGFLISFSRLRGEADRKGWPCPLCVHPSDRAPAGERKRRRRARPWPVAPSSHLGRTST